MINIGAASASTGGHAQARAYMKNYGEAIDTSASQFTARSGVRESSSLGTPIVESPDRQECVSRHGRQHSVSTVPTGSRCSLLLLQELQGSAH
jgi:hypothetical protein